MIKDGPCSCKGNDKNCYNCGGTGNPFLLKRATSFPYSPRLQKIPSQVEDPGYRSQPRVMRAGGTSGLSSSSKLKCSHCDKVFSGLAAIQNHTFHEHLIPALFETLPTDKKLSRSRGGRHDVPLSTLNGPRAESGNLGKSPAIQGEEDFYKTTEQTQLPVKPQKKIPCHLCKKLCNGRLGLVQHVRVKHPESLSADGTSYIT